jgi:hypothetical protein
MKMSDYDYNKYQGICDETGEVDGVKCTWCGHFAPLGVPIWHAEDCSPPNEEMK